MGNATVTIDDVAFNSEDTGQRVQQRGQRVIRGTMAGNAVYTTDGDGVDLANYFPANNFRVILSPASQTGNRLGVYDATNKKLIIFTGLGTQAAGGTNQSANGIFSFIAIGE